MAIVETCAAIPLYWWIATRYGFLQPLIAGACVAPLLLLRSPESISLGAKWAADFEQLSSTEISADFKMLSRGGQWAVCVVSLVGAGTALLLLYPVWPQNYLALLIVVPLTFSVGFLVIGALAVTFSLLANELFWLLDVSRIPKGWASWMNLWMKAFIRYGGFSLGLFLLCLGIRFVATAKFLPAGTKRMPGNFRTLALCMSPAQKPELIPNAPKNSLFDIRSFIELLRGEGLLGFILAIFAIVVMFGPPWLYRISIKSTAWFWFPLAFLGGEVSQNVDLLRFRITGSLWAKTTLVTSAIMLASFLATNLIKTGAILQTNPLLTPLGYLLLIDWSPRLWQLSAIAVSVISILLVFWLNSVSGEYRIATSTNDHVAKRRCEIQFDAIQRVARFRLICSVVFWTLVATQAFLYFNSQHCWTTISDEKLEIAKTVFGNQLPPNNCIAL
jgi:hypothetical protein